MSVVEAPDRSVAYRHKTKPGVAWQLTEWMGDPGYVKFVMVGDDHEWVFSMDEMEPLDVDDWCGGCGQIGCGHG